MNKFYNISFEIWNDYKRWDKKNSNEVENFLNYLNVEIDNLKDRQKQVENIKKLDLLLSRIIDIDLLNKSREINFLYQDIEHFLNYLTLRETGSLDYYKIPYLIKVLEFFKKDHKKKDHKNKLNVNSYFKLSKRIIEAFLLKKPIIKLDYNLVKYFIDNDNSIEWSRDFLKSWINRIEPTLIIEDSFLEQILWFFKIEFKRLLSVFPKESNQGFGKMLKVLLGVFIYSLDNTLDIKTQKDKNILLNNLKLGYYWGVSYPLVDDVLDSGILNENQVIKFSSKLFLSFKGEIIDDIDDLPKFCILLFEYINKMAKIVNKSNINSILEILNLAHLAQIKKFNSEFAIDDFYINTMLKASLIRIATIKLADKEIKDDFIHNCILVSIHNQLEDDFKDFFEDVGKSNKTAFTLFQDKKIIENPIITLIKYNMFIASKFDDPEKVIKLFAIQFCEIIKYIKNRYGNSNLLYLANIFYDHEVNIKEKILKISKYTDSIYYINSEIYLLDYLEENIKKYKNYA